MVFQIENIHNSSGCDYFCLNFHILDIWKSNLTKLKCPFRFRFHFGKFIGPFFVVFYAEKKLTKMLLMDIK